MSMSLTTRRGPEVAREPAGLRFRFRDSSSAEGHLAAMGLLHLLRAVPMPWDFGALISREPFKVEEARAHAGAGLLI